MIGLYSAGADLPTPRPTQQRRDSVLYLLNRQGLSHAIARSVNRLMEDFALSYPYERGVM